MSESPLDRTLSFRLACVHDCWGNRRAVRTASQNGVWFIDGYGVQTPETPEASPPPPDASESRPDQLARLRASGRFSVIELATLDALITGRLSINDIAERDGCSRQAVISRILGNSKGQGGILRKARAVLAPQGATCVPSPL